MLRIRATPRAGARLASLVGDVGVPAALGGIDRSALALGARLAPRLPGVVVPIARERLRRELSGIVLPAEQRPLARHLAARRAAGIASNVNLLGEAVLGAGEARERAAQIAALLARRDIDYVSVKISSICAQIDVLAYDDSLERICEQLRPLYRQAASFRPAKFVNLDMEEYRDLHLTIDAFVRLLSEDELAPLDAGIVLQAYLPDSLAALERLAGFARARYARAGGRTKVRLVKGANLAMERVDAELRGLAPAPFATKAEVDANYKRLLDLALSPENADALRIGVASHNLFDVGWALAAAADVGASARLELEMLEGMANPQARATAEIAGRLLLYAPVVHRREFDSAVAYLVRRFDENTAPENLLAHLFALEPGSAAWEVERTRFSAAVRDRHAPPAPSRRDQRRLDDAPVPEEVGAPVAFANVADTDFTQAENRAWLARAVAAWTPPANGAVPAVIGGERVTAPLSGTGIDPSAPGSPLYRYVEASAADVARAVALGAAAAAGWHGRGASARAALLRRVAAVMEAGRGPTIVTMARDAGRVLAEADAEISEAVDFANYYADQAVGLDARSGTFTPYGLVVVAPPWNFPYSIPAGGVLAALAAGSAVILKPAPESVLCAYRLAEQCWAAGVPKDVLQFVPCADDEVGRALITHEQVDAVILTGAFETARLFLSWRPDLALHAETSGKNAIVITAAADMDDAIRDLVRSAFGHAGQKCSAASLAIVEAAVYDDGRFLERLADAVSSLRVGPAIDPATQVGPLIRPPTGRLARALSELAPGERWLVAPQRVGGSDLLWSPGVKLGVAPGSEFHREECFGPVLGVMRAADLDAAIALQNAPAYGLTGGIHSLDEAEVAHWRARVAVGNAYVNRHITGAIVRRQPFGGWKRSSVGPGAKAGGPNYVASLGSWRADPGARAADELAAATALWARLSAGEDPSGLAAEENLFRLRALDELVLRLGAPPEPEALALLGTLAGVIGCRLRISAAAPYPGVPVGAAIESEAAFAVAVGKQPPARVRLCGASAELALAALDAGCEVDTRPLVAIAELALLALTREQAVSATRHRHGNVRARRAGR